MHTTTNKRRKGTLVLVFIALISAYMFEGFSWSWWIGRTNLFQIESKAWERSNKGLLGIGFRQYPPCPDVRAIKHYSSDLEYTLYHIKRAKVLTNPYSFVFLCNILPQDLYIGLVKSFPSFNSNISSPLNNPFEELGSDRTYIHLADMRKIETFHTSYQHWERLSNILESKEFTKTLLVHFGLESHLDSYSGPNPRLLSHSKNFTLDIHPDSRKKILTMMIYFPTEEESREARFAFGTNVHSLSQSEKGNRDEWHLRFQYLPNSGYVMKISPTSFHSVSKLSKEFQRKTIVLNWYSTKKVKTKEVRFLQSNSPGFLLTYKGLRGEEELFSYSSVRQGLKSLQMKEARPRATTEIRLWPFKPYKDRGYCISVGATSGTDDPLWYLVSKKEYEGIFFEAQESTFLNLQRNVLNFPGVIAVNTPLTPHNVGDILDHYEVPSVIDWLKMNIDSCDCPLTEAIVKSRKVRMVVMETNHNIPPPLSWGLNYSPDTRFCVRPHAYYGCSLQYQVNMLKYHGYQLLSYQGGDALFGLPDMVKEFKREDYAKHPLVHFLHDPRSRKCAVSKKGCHSTADPAIMNTLLNLIKQERLDEAQRLAEKFFSAGKEHCEASFNQGFENYQISKTVK